MDARARKDALRRLALARRGRMDPAERARRGAAAVDAALALPEVASADPVFAFVAIASEIPTEMLLRAVLGSGRVLLVPYVADDGALRAAPVGSLEELGPGYRGIPEPRARIPVDPAAAGVAIVPGVAFAPDGARLGYGGGFFDAFLRTMPAVPRVGICYDAQIVEAIPTEEHDEPVDVVVTEERVIRTGARA